MRFTTLTTVLALTFSYTAARAADSAVGPTSPPPAKTVVAKKSQIKTQAITSQTTQTAPITPADVVPPAAVTAPSINMLANPAPGANLLPAATPTPTQYFQPVDPEVYRQQQEAQQQADQQKAQEQQQWMRTIAPLGQQLMSGGLGGGGNGGGGGLRLNGGAAGPGRDGVSSGSVNGSSTRPFDDGVDHCAGAKMNPSLLSSYQKCTSKGIGAGFAADSQAFLVDADSKVGFIVKNGVMEDCFNIILGSESMGNPAKLGTGQDETEPGLFKTGVHGVINGVPNPKQKYSTCEEGKVYSGAVCKATCYQGEERDVCIPDAISMGIECGKVIHSGVGLGSTLGCIGVKNGRFEDLKNKLGTSGADVYVWGQNYQGCGHSGESGSSGASETHEPTPHESNK